MENYPDIEEPKKKGFTVGKLFKWLAFAVIAAIYLILIARCSMYSDDKIVSEILVNDVTRAAYQAAPENFTVEQYGMQKAWVAITEGRMVEFNYLYHIKAAKQLQISVKFNKDIFADEKTPADSLKFYLTDENGTVYDEYFYKEKQKFDYRYIRLCFENVELTDEALSPDESGAIPRKSYTLHFEKPMPDGSYEEVCAYRIYSGSDISKIIPFSLK